jgi:hypothetical protein
MGGALGPRDNEATTPALATTTSTAISATAIVSNRFRVSSGASNVVHQLRAALARPWPVSAYAEVSQRPDSKGDQCGGFAARGVTGRIRQLHARVRQHP